MHRTKWPYEQNLPVATKPDAFVPTETPMTPSLPRHYNLLVATGANQTIYLQDLRRPRSQILIEFTKTVAQNTNANPRPGAYIVGTAFHPQIKSLFLLAHSDGTISIHDARRICRSQTTGTTTNGMKRIAGHVHHKPIVAAMFLAGYKMRTISLGENGKCKIMDFEHGVNTIIAWKVGQDCTSLAVLSPTTMSCNEEESDISLEKDVTRLNHTLAIDTAVVPCHIAVGARDGSVLVYSAVGLLEYRTRATGHEVKGIWWVPSPSTPILPGRSAYADDIVIKRPPTYSDIAASRRAPEHLQTAKISPIVRTREGLPAARRRVPEQTISLLESLRLRRRALEQRYGQHHGHEHTHHLHVPGHFIESDEDTLR
jgi:hypothetical protein